MKGVSLWSIICFIGFLILLLLQGTAWAHSVNYTILEGVNPVVLEFHYSDGQAVSYAEVKIWAPDDVRLEYQNGRTDRKGRFTFLPSQSSGAWRLTLNDGLGHSISDTLDVAYQAAIVTQSDSSSEGLHSTNVFALLGVSLLLNLGFICQHFLNRPGKATQQDAQDVVG